MLSGMRDRAGLPPARRVVGVLALPMVRSRLLLFLLWLARLLVCVMHVPCWHSTCVLVRLLVELLLTIRRAEERGPARIRAVQGMLLINVHATDRISDHLGPPVSSFLK